MIHVSPRQLEVFVQAVAGGSLRAAAEALHLTQPAVSMALADMERLLGGQLFDRRRGRLHLNARGREVLPLAQELLERHAELVAVAADGGGPHGELRIGTSNTVGNYRVGELLGEFVRRHPDAGVNLQVGNTGDIAQAVREHRLDVGCVEGPVIHAELELLPWREDRLQICVAPDHLLAGRSGLEPADFADQRWILREPGSATRSLSEQALARLPAPQRVLQLDQTEAIKQAVAAGLGIACLPEVAILDAVAAGRLCALQTPFLQLQRTLSLLLHRGRYRGALLRAFLQSLQLPSAG
ncbi:LysR family transcriptional regulator [Pseudoxanthomonas kalamensis DSM 18571]|uniref:LysR family transcriptional regulator n=1 Tax=Pseudoxanthomonas kalamensis TaxID=289483 RepID=UPI0013918C2D|nr:LysR family transcriptional regulator [Pseudoxanthomonas kalamensis]KAF1708861.1 LysR family transcriptional regulator [Pseudoxanthomonas kalamensis DSM 18571]